MKRLAIITVGKTHSGKTTFAKALENKLNHSIIMDQDNTADFLNTYYQNLLPKQGPNFLKHSISKVIVEYAKKHTDGHIITCSANRTKKGRTYLLEDIYDKHEFVRTLVHFDIPDDILLERVRNSKRSTNILRRSYSTFEEVLISQQGGSMSKDVVDPEEGEADYLFVIREHQEVESVMNEIVQIASGEALLKG
ncbi:AAA family ATPase [Rossellomorea sp. YZS02]|uniref:AAA family ATPase n=1 Tax=Rossellomorea sp. YZS02 TaxID=3097358 RepID=UPI002A1672E4|nr:AAA family ATPase [Rossellomorea sp. YZS02]MDX8342215.1 AAA family ATPase [Rossellomorea sp. YZS02]